MARKYSKGFFRIFKKGTKAVRDHYSADPLEEIKETGLAGKIIGKGADKIIETPIKKVSYAMTGLTYDKNSDNPCKGSATYTVWYMSLKKAAKVFIGFLIGLPICGAFVAFLNADLLTQIRMLLGLVPICLLVAGVCRVVKWFKGLFK